jgi:hypothetical protein
MPNLYATPTEVKAAAPDIVQAATTKYDGLLLRLCNQVSRQIDKITGKEFYPEYATLTLTPEEESYILRIPDLISLTSAAWSADGINYTTISSSYIVPTVEGDRNGDASYTHLRLLWTSPVTSWPAIEDGVQVTGVWAYHDERDDAWEAAGKLSSAYTAGGASLKVADVTINDRWGYGTAFHAGRIVKVGSEIFEVTGVTNSTGAQDTISVLGARNGSTAANHASSAVVYLWRPCSLVTQATIIEVVKLLERGLQGFANARATPEMGQPVWEKKLDVQTLELLSKVMEF